MNSMRAAADFFSCELDAVLVERSLDTAINLLSERELLAGLGHEFPAHHDADVVDFQHALALEGLHHISGVFGDLHQFRADFLEDFFDLVDVGVEGDREAQLHDHPVARIVGDLRDFAIGDGVHGAAVMAKLQGADRGFFDGADRALDVNIFALSERIVDQEEGAGDHVGHQLLRAETDGEANDAGACEKRRDVDMQGAERHQHGDHRDR